MSAIKLIPGRMAQLRGALRSEAERLQQAANQVARIGDALDMELKSREGIDAALTQLRKRLKAQQQNLALMESLASAAEAGIADEDTQLAGEADRLLYTMRQMIERAGAAGGAAGISASASSGSSTGAALNLGSQLALDSLADVSALFTALGDRLQDALLSGVPLGSLNGAEESEFLSTIQKLAVAATAGGTVALGSKEGITNLLEALTPVSSESGSVKGASKKKEEKKEEKNPFKKLGAGIANAWDGAKDAAADAWDGAKELAGEVKDAADDAWEDAKELAGDIKDAADDAWEDAKDFAGDAKEVAADVWGGIKKVVNSKPMSYVWEMGGDTLGGLSDIAGYCSDMGSGNIAGAVVNGYSFLDNVLNFSQDLSALGMYGLGKGAEALGIGGESVMENTIKLADEMASRDGYVGELRANGFDGTADVVQSVEGGIGVYKLVTGVVKIKDNPLLHLKDAEKGEALSALFELSGWKLPSSGADLAQKISGFDDLASNLDLAYKYVDGFVGETGLQAILENTTPGKIISGPGKIIDAFSEVFSEEDTETAAEETDS